MGMKNKIPSWLRNHPRTTELLMSLSMFKTQKNNFNWRFEALSTMMALIGMLLILIFAGKELNSLDPKTAYLVSTEHDHQEICVNVTCGSLYCLFKQPVGCETSQRFLQLDEVSLFCNQKTNCNWNVEVVTESGLENRSTSLYIISESGSASYFPPLQHYKLQAVDIQRYSKTDEVTTTVDWSVIENTRAKVMKNCGSSNLIPHMENMRCGAYEMFISSTAYTTETQQKWKQEQENVAFSALAKSVSVYFFFNWLTWSYANMTRLKNEISGKSD